MVKTLSYNAGSPGLISGRGAEVPHASRPENQNIKQKQYCNKFNKDFENGPHQKKKKKKHIRLGRSWDSPVHLELTYPGVIPDTSF